jgi:hypothetical protein
MLASDDADRDMPPTHLGKHPRAISSTSSNFVASKKHRSEQAIPTRPRDAAREGSPVYKQREHEALAVAAGRGSRGSRVTSAVQPAATGTISSASDDATTANGTGDATPFRVDSTTQGHKKAPQPKSTRDTEKRSLRSHDGGSRSRSELSLYFPNYEDLISNEPKEPGTCLSGLANTRLLQTPLG